MPETVEVVACEDCTPGQIVSIGEDGTIRALDSGTLPLAPLGVVMTRRASRILPVHPLKRPAFRLLRRAFGDHGRVAAWTRRWRGPWEAFLLDTGERHVAATREACLAWERSKLE